MRIGFVELVLLLFIASLTVGPNVALFVDRWLRRAQRTSAAAARRKAQLEAQAAIEREALMTRFRVASNIFALLMLAALAYGLLLRPIDTPPKAYTAPDVRQDTGAAQTALSADSKDGWKLGGYLGVDCVRTQDGLVYAAAYNGAAMKKRQSDLVRTDGGHTAAILSVEGELTSFAWASSSVTACRASISICFLNSSVIKNTSFYTLADSRLAEPAAPKYTLLPAGHTAVQPSSSLPENVCFQLPSAVSTASAQGASAGNLNSFFWMFSPARRAMPRRRVLSACFSNQPLRVQR